MNRFRATAVKGPMSRTARIGTAWSQLLFSLGFFGVSVLLAGKFCLAC
jgi:hypothetical protein